ncbi:unnamed protein product [Malus baccata var. baccata]
MSSTGKLILDLCALTTTNSSSMHLNTVEPLTGVNYKKWKQDLEIVLGVMDWDLALGTEEPLTPTDGSTSNATNAKDFLKSIEQKYQEPQKTEIDATNANDFLNSIEEKHDGIESLCEYILKMVDIAGKLKALEVLIPETFLVHVILSSLLDSYTHLKLSYNALREKWDVNELISFENEKIKSLNYVRSTNEAHTPLTTDTRKNSTKRVPSPKRNTKPNKPSILKHYFCIRLGLPHEER